jgi:CheY-like chemotaxis protein
VARILVVDDDALLRRMLVRAIRRAHPSWVVVDVSSGAEALLHLATNDDSVSPFSAVLLDRNMPGMSGIETAARIRERANNASEAIPIIVLSGNLERADEEALHAIGVHRFLVKPIDNASLLHELNSAVRAKPLTTHTTLPEN